VTGKPPVSNSERSELSRDSETDGEELDYYNDWLRITNLRLITRPQSIGVYSVEVEGSKFTFTEKKPNGRKTEKKKVTRKFAGTGSTKKEAALNLFRTVRLYDTCHTPSGNYNTPYYTKGR